MSWSAGYVTDIDYTYGYYKELNPCYARYVLLDAGYALSPWQHACELGFGQGMSINLHAASGELQWHGNDFNPQHVAFAQALAGECGNQACLSDESFAEFCRRDDLPAFDFIGLHGIWSWISADNRQLIVDFVRRRLRVGGVLYISYNVLPGWSSYAPLRQLFCQHAERMSAPGLGVPARVQAALAFSQQLLSLSPGALADDKVKARLAQIAKQDPHYLAHEYFNRDWEPMYFADMAAALAGAKLSYACQANPLELVPALHFSAEQQALLDGIDDPLFRETVRDFIQNQNFRRDYWVKGAVRLPLKAQLAQWQRQRVMLALPRQEVKLKLLLPRGMVNLRPALYEPVLEVLADGAAHRLESIGAKVLGKDFVLGQLIEVMRVLIGAHMVLPLPEAAPGQAATAMRLNQRLLQMAADNSQLAVLASPELGGGLPVSRFSQLFLQQYLAGQQQPEGLAQALHGLLVRNHERVMHEGAVLSSEQAQLDYLRAQAKRFIDSELATLQAAGVCPPSGPQ